MSHGGVGLARASLDKMEQKRGVETDLADQKIDRRHNVYAAILFVVFFVVFGVPVWWNTTRVYRAPLPYGDISNFQYATLQLPVSISLVAGDDTTIRVLTEENVMDRVDRAVSTELHRVKIALKLTVRHYSEEEKSILSSEIESFSQLENSLDSVSSSSNSKTDGIEIFILHRSSQPRRVYFGSGIRIFVIGDFRSQDRQQLANDISDIILNGYLRVDEWMATVSRRLKEEMNPILKNSSSTKFTSGVLNPKLALEVHVVDPDPIRCPQRFPIDRILEEKTVKSFLARIKDITEVSVKSQMLYSIDFNHEPSRKGRDGFYYFNPAILQHLINPIETYMSTVVTTEPVYHMLLYLPQDSHRPLMVVEANLNPVAYNSFVVSGWGSVTVINADRRCSDQGELVIDPTVVTETKRSIIANLRKHLGLQWPENFQRAPTPLTQWEIQSLRYRAIVEYTFSSIHTLVSLTKLLDEITNLVINDDVADSIHSAVSEINTVLSADRVESMLESSAHAYQESEKAFFDPSLLALLYFPDDQKYAIYVPLFLPIGVPVVGSIFFIKKYFKNGFGKVKSD